jgi:hypothetical protein
MVDRTIKCRQDGIGVGHAVERQDAAPKLVARQMLGQAHQGQFGSTETQAVNNEEYAQRACARILILRWIHERSCSTAIVLSPGRLHVQAANAWHSGKLRMRPVRSSHIQLRGGLGDRMKRP